MTKKFSTNSKFVFPKNLSVKARFRKKLRDFVLDTASILNRHDSDNFLRCLYCHYVFDDQVEKFKAIINTLSGIGNFVDSATALKMLNGETPIIGRNFHLSFDDGFENNFSNAFPILKERNIPAIFFVPTSLVNADYESVKDYCLNKTNYGGVFEMMSWDQLAALSDSGYDIGSHTKTHARLSEISETPARLEDEISGSKIEIETKLGIGCDFISWPFGRISDADEFALDMIRNSGYKGCFGGYRGPLIPNKTDLMSIPRHHFEASWPLRHILYFARGNGE